MKNIAIFLCALCAPYLCTVLWGNAGRAADMAGGTDAVPVFAAVTPGKTDGIRYLAKDYGWFEERVDAEDYIAECMSGYVPEETEPEAMKALAVVLRTDLREGQTVPRQTRSDPVGERYRNAAEATRGITLAYEGAQIHALWTYVSNGSTRDGTENRIASSGYLKKKDCNRDILSQEYSSEAVYGRKQFEEHLAVLAGVSETGAELEKDDFGWPVFMQIRDSAGYTRKIVVGTKEIEGGVFAEAFCLRSTSFDMEFRDEDVVFHVEGCGHGFGMSLYTADRMAAEGKDFMEILSFFYPGTELKK